MANMKITRSLYVCTGIDGFADIRIFCSVTLQHIPEGQTCPIDLAKGHSSMESPDFTALAEGFRGQEAFLQGTEQGQKLYLQAMAELTKSVEEKAKQNLYKDAIDKFQLVEAVNG